MIFIKIIFIIVIVATVLVIILYAINLIKTILTIKGDFNLTVRAILKSVVISPKKLFVSSGWIQKKSNLSIEMEKMGKGYTVISEENTTINESFLEGKQQYKIKILNKNVDLIDVRIKFKFPVGVFEEKITKEEGVESVRFKAEIPLFKGSVSGGGSVTIPGRKYTSFYNLTIDKLNADGLVELIVTLDFKKALSQEIKYIAGTYSRIINNERLEQEIYYPIEGLYNNLSLGEKSNKIPQLTEGFDIHF